MLTWIAGCGNDLQDVLAARSQVISECGDASNAGAELITLDWGGGYTALYPDTSFDAIDLSLFELADGGTLADNPEAFREAVRSRITSIYCDSTAPPVRIVQAEDATQPAGTLVFFTQAVSPRDPMQVGEGEYDPCNQQHDNTAVIFGEQIRELTKIATFDEWVSIFSNVAAHEIGHTLGYQHVSHDQFAAAGPSDYVELMLDGHTISQLLSDQRFVVPQDTCR